MKFDSIIFLLDRQMAAIRPEKPLNLFGKDSERQNADGFNWISLEKLPQIPMIPSYCHLEESGEAAEEIYGQLRPYVKGFFKKQSILLCAPDDAPVYVDQKYIREFFIHKSQLLFSENIFFISSFIWENLEKIQRIFNKKYKDLQNLYFLS